MDAKQVPTYTVYRDGKPVEQEGFRDPNLDDLYWSNKFAQKEREQEAAAFEAKMLRDEELFRA